MTGKCSEDTGNYHNSVNSDYDNDYSVDTNLIKEAQGMITILVSEDGNSYKVIPEHGEEKVFSAIDN